MFQRPGQYTEGEAEGLRLSPRLGGATPLLPLSPLHITKGNCCPWQWVKLQRHRPLSTTGARDHIGVDQVPFVICNEEKEIDEEWHHRGEGRVHDPPPHLRCIALDAGRYRSPVTRFLSISQ